MNKENCKAVTCCSSNLKKELHDFLEYNDPHELKNNLQKLLMSYMIHQKNDFPDYFHNLLISLEGLFELLEVAGTEAKLSVPLHPTHQLS